MSATKYLPAERALPNVVTHMIRDHGIRLAPRPAPTIRLSHYLRHRRLHQKGIMTAPHTHARPTSEV